VADALGFSDRHLAAIENGRTPNPGFLTVADLARFYAVDLAELVGQKPPELTPELHSIVRLLDDKSTAEVRFARQLLETIFETRPGIMKLLPRE
jgi:transcriptional regulator with XRE-family HTH domain